MNREEAIRIFRKEIECLSHAKCEDCILEKACDPAKTTPLDSEYIEAYGMAIQALSQEPCDDAISRQVAIDAFERFIHELGIEDKPYNYGEMALSAKNVPPVTSQQNVGHWISKDGKEQGYDIGGVKTWYIQIMCSECGFIKTAIEGHIGQYQYCPSCGARMESEQNE